jgi:hypothetical protein
VHRARHQFLAGAALAGDQHARAGGPHAPHLLADRLHGHGFAHHQRAPLHLVAQRTHLATQVAAVQRIADGDQQALLAERLLDEVEGAVARGLDRGGNGPVAADHDHRQLGVVLAQPPQHLDAVHARQPHVDHRHIGTLGLAALEAVLAALGHVDCEPLGSQHHGKRAADVPLIIDDQDPGTHAAPSSVADVAATAAVNGRSTVNAAP